MVSVPVRRQQVMDAMRRGVSQRRACTLMRVARPALGDRSRLAAKDAPVLARMAALSGQYPRYGYRRMRILLARAGHAMSAGRASAVAACRPAASAPAAAPAPRARSPRQRNSAIPTRRCCSRRQPHRLGELHVAGLAVPLQGGQQAQVETVEIDRHRILADFGGFAAGSCKKQGAIPRTRHEISD
jgi:hypothetical protein